MKTVLKSTGSCTRTFSPDTTYTNPKEPDTQQGYLVEDPMFHSKRTIFLLAAYLLASFVIPPRLALACQRLRSGVTCPMKQMQRLQKRSCCAKSAASGKPAMLLSSACCCHFQPAPEKPTSCRLVVFPEERGWVLPTSLPLAAEPSRSTIRVPAKAVDFSTPRGPPLPFASLRAPPVTS